MLNIFNRFYDVLVALGVFVAPVVVVCAILGMVLKKSSTTCGVLITAGSVIWMAGLWLGSVINVYTLWGAAAVVLGLLLGGVGVIPLAIIAKFTHGYPKDAAGDLLMIAVIVGAQILAKYIVLRGQRQTLAKSVATF